MDLVPYMYFERQEPGSQLCAQHCLNNILQQYTYSEFDLADIAKKLDQAENATLDASHQNKKSYNLDDTGFFSISVLERALEVWDLSLVRWRGEAMKAYQEHPEDQTAFILNLSSHWLPLRRFAPNPPHSAATKRWYNLNSFHTTPQWISPTYLRLFLTQAEQEGYSVFVVRKARSGTAEGQDAGEGQGWEDGGVAQLPECLADQMAVELGEPVGRGGPVSTTGSGLGQWAAHTQSSSINPDTTTVDLSGPSQVQARAQAGSSSPPARRRRRQEDLTPSDSIEEDEFSRPPVTVTRTRQSSSRSTPALNPIGSADIFDDESFPLDHDHTNAPSGIGQAGLGAPHDNDDDDEDILSDNEDLPGMGRIGAGGEGIGGMGSHGDASYSGPTDFQFQSRSYDDEDAALQAALKASMMDLPPGWEAPPELPPKASEKPVLQSTITTNQSAASSRPSTEPSASTSTAAPPVTWRPAAGESAHQVKKEDAEKEDIVEEEDDEDEKPAERVSA
ncbi:ataxin-3, partial [Kwoniella heveanensis CBS 569]